jgi:hypothetical protein
MCIRQGVRYNDPKTTLCKAGQYFDGIQCVSKFENAPSPVTSPAVAPPVVATPTPRVCVKYKYGRNGKKQGCREYAGDKISQPPPAPAPSCPSGEYYDLQYKQCAYVK